MNSKASRFGPRKIGLPFAVLATVLALGLPGQVWADQTESSTETITGTANQIIGDASGNGIAGPAIAFNNPIVIQHNIQVDTTDNPNNDQNAANDATIGQNTTAASGDASGINGGTATSGAATAISTAIVLQLNIQIITGFTPAEGVTQNASNVADVDQDTVAASGTSSADGAGSTATSGNATANNSAYLSQVNVQVYSGTPMGVDNSGTVTQTAANGGTAAQETGAGTGTATAADGSTATSGSARAYVEALISQYNWQY
jgi:hypothetical protein